MNFKRPIETLKHRAIALRVNIHENPKSLVKFSDKAITDMRQELEEHERAIEFLKQIIHIST